MSQPRIVRVLASVRLPSSRTPDLDYELVHATVQPNSGSEEIVESVLLRRVRADGTVEGAATEIDLRDLPDLHANWTRFVTDVLWRRAQSGDSDSQAALQRFQGSGGPVSASPPGNAAPVISASGGRFGERSKRSDSVPMGTMGSKKASGPALPPPSRPPPPAEPDAFRIPENYQVVGFTLSSPPTVEGLMKLLQAEPESLVVVAQKAVALRAEEYIRKRQSGALQGEPDSFSPVVVLRTSQRIPVAQKKFRTSLAGGLARAVGDFNIAVWIPPL